MLLCRYTPFRADEMKEVVRQATQARVDFHDRYWKVSLTKVRLGPVAAYGNALI